jgi:DNA excision repair protein ERCC-3
MAMKTRRPNRSTQAWIEARKRHHLSHAQVQMARELGMNPAKLDKLNPAKLQQLHSILGAYPDGRVLILGEYIDQVEAIARDTSAPLVTGKTAQADRERLYDQFRTGQLRCIVLSKVGNFAIDLPDADVLIQVSGAFGSRQEEAQRLGRILRPKNDGRVAHFFTLVSRDTREEEFAHHRKLFLTEQGYAYQIWAADRV